MWCGGVYIGGARMREKEDINGDWEVIGCNELVKTDRGMYLDVLRAKRKSNELNWSL